MSIVTEAAAKILAKMRESYSQGAAEGAPPPENGTYVLQLVKPTVREFVSTAGGKSKEFHVIGLLLRVLGCEAYKDYQFKVEFWDSNPVSMGNLAVFVTLANGGVAITDVVQAYAFLLSQAGRIAWTTEISRRAGKADAKTGAVPVYVQLDPVNVIVLEPPAPPAPGEQSE